MDGLLHSFVLVTTSLPCVPETKLLGIHESLSTMASGRRASCIRYPGLHFNLGDSQRLVACIEAALPLGGALIVVVVVVVVVCTNMDDFLLPG